MCVKGRATWASNNYLSLWTFHNFLIYFHCVLVGISFDCILIFVGKEVASWRHCSVRIRCTTTEKVNGRFFFIVFDRTNRSLAKELISQLWIVVVHRIELNYMPDLFESYFFGLLKKKIVKNSENCFRLQIQFVADDMKQILVSIERKWFSLVSIDPYIRFYQYSAIFHTSYTFAYYVQHRPIYHHGFEKKIGTFA